MSEKNKNKLDFSQRELTAEGAIYVLAVAAVRADGVIEDEELNAILSIAETLGHNQQVDDAIAYHNELGENDKAMLGAMRVIKGSSESAKVAALALMSYVLEQDDLYESEVEFYDKVVAELKT
jgi:CTP synthase (UTP-ammonia lyase)